MSSRLAMAVCEGWRHLLRHPLRSMLTATTCAVAIAVTVNVISLSYGMDEDIRRDLARFGRLTIDVGRSPLIRPGAPRAQFGDQDVERVKRAVAGLGAVVVPLKTERAAVAGDAELEQAVLAAVTPDYPKTLAIDLAAGRWLRADEKGLSACVLDESAAKTLFPSTPVSGVPGKRVRVTSSQGQHEMPVVGVLADPMTYRALFEAFDEGRVSRTLVAALLSFRNVYVPEDALSSKELTLVHVVLPDDARLEQAKTRLEAIWPPAAMFDPFKPQNVSPVNVFTRKLWIDAFGGVTQTTALVGNIVWMLICLVACVMVSTLHLVTIRERYDEMAVRRCEGARRSDVVAQVAGEGLFLSIAGGLLGLPIGYLGAEVMRWIVEFPFRFEPRYAVVAFGVSVVVGLVSAALPARHAASLDPAAVLSRRLS